MQIEFNVEGERISRSLQAVAGDIDDLTVPFKEVESTLLKTFDANFDVKGAEYGGWAPRKPIFRKGVRFDTWPLMEKTGKMRKAFDGIITDRSLTLFNPTEYFKYHQSKDPRKSNLPRRAMMGLRADDGQMIVKAFQKYVITVMRQQGLR